MVDFGPSLVKFSGHVCGRSWSSSGQLWPIPGHPFGQLLCRFRAKQRSSQLARNSDRSGPIRANFGRIPPQVFPIRPNLVKLWPVRAEFGARPEITPKMPPRSFFQVLSRAATFVQHLLGIFQRVEIGGGLPGDTSLVKGQGANSWGVKPTRSNAPAVDRGYGRDTSGAAGPPTETQM